GERWNTARIQWHAEPPNVTLAELLRPPVQEKTGPEPTARDNAAVFILAFLEDGPKLATDMEAMAELQDISQRTLYRAAKQLGVIKTRENTEDGRRTWWSLPDHDT